MSSAVENALRLWAEAATRGSHLAASEALEAVAGQVLPADLERLRKLILDYRRIEKTFESSAQAGPESEGAESGGSESPVSEFPDSESGARESASSELPSFDGLRTVERIGRGGSGDVFKLEDPRLGRQIAGKLLRATSHLNDRPLALLEEARALALFDDPRIVRVLEVRDTEHGQLLLMDLVEGYPLTEVANSLEPKQKARIVADIADAIEGAHRKGVQHRDLKPRNVLLNRALQPRILDFGLSSTDPAQGHYRGTLAYMAPELFDATAAIDERSDIYSLGVLLYELLVGHVPFSASRELELIEQIRTAEPHLPVELRDAVPEPLQAVALKAMERDPQDRYSSARELARDLERYLADQPVVARPTRYRARLERQVSGHLDDLGEWRRSKLIYSHEASALERGYRRLLDRGEDWIVDARRLSLSRVVLYLGVFLIGSGAVLSFLASYNEGLRGLVWPIVWLGTPIAALGAGGVWLFGSQARATGVALLMASVFLVPVLTSILLRELGWSGFWSLDEDRLFSDGQFENLQLQLGGLVAFALADS